jgi:hypothetical protein
MCDTRSVKVVIAALLVAACGSGPRKGPDQPPPPPPAVADDPTCPIVVPGTSMVVEETAEGPAFVFVTTGDVAAVRTRAAALATMHNMRGGPSSALGMMFSEKAKATKTDIEGGARVVFAGDPDVVESMRMHAQLFTGATTCEMKM